MMISGLVLPLPADVYLTICHGFGFGLRSNLPTILQSVGLLGHNFAIYSTSGCLPKSSCKNRVLKEIVTPFSVTYIKSGLIFVILS